MKSCTKCGTSKQLSEFYKNVRNRDGLQTACKACMKVASASYYAANKERCNEAIAKWTSANKDKRKADNAAWYQANKDRVKANSAKWREANPGKSREYTYKWQSANHESVRIYSHNRRARKREIGGKLSKGLSDKLFKLQRGKCACGCNKPLGSDYHLDHMVPLALGGANEDWNMQLLRAVCNMQKGKKHPIEYMQQKGFLL